MVCCHPLLSSPLEGEGRLKWGGRLFVMFGMAGPSFFCWRLYV